MFGFSLGELFIVLLISFSLLKKEDVKTILKLINKAKAKLVTYREMYLKQVQDIVDEKEFIIDMDGNQQITYDLTKIMPNIKTSSKNNE